MVEHPDIHAPPDDQPDVDKFAALADAPVTALGLSRRLTSRPSATWRTTNMSDGPRQS
jgi:hypothetical protein